MKEGFEAWEEKPGALGLRPIQSIASFWSTNIAPREILLRKINNVRKELPQYIAK